MNTVVSIDRSRISEALRLVRDAKDSLFTAFIGVDQDLVDQVKEISIVSSRHSDILVDFNSDQIPTRISVQSPHSEVILEYLLLTLKFRAVLPTPIEMLEGYDDDEYEHSWHSTYSLVEAAETLQKAVRELLSLRNSPYETLLNAVNNLYARYLNSQEDLFTPFATGKDGYIKIPAAVWLHIHFDYVIDTLVKATKTKV